MNICSLDLSNFITILSTISSIVSIIVAIYIFYQWKKQKRIEVISNESNIILNDITELRKEVLIKRNEGSIDNFYISTVSDRRDLIEFRFKQIKIEYKNLEYKNYISSITNLIREWQKSDKDDSQLLIKFGLETNNLSEVLIKLKYYMY